MFEWGEIINSILFLSLCRYLLNMRNLVILLIFVSCALSVAMAGKCRTKLKILSRYSECEGGVCELELVGYSSLHHETFNIGEWWGVI